MKQGVQEREILEQNQTASAERYTPVPAPTRGTQARKAETSGWTPVKRNSFPELISKPAEVEDSYPVEDFFFQAVKFLAVWTRLDCVVHSRMGVHVRVLGASLLSAS